MKLNGLIIILLVFIISGCTDKKEPVSEIPIDTNKLMEHKAQPTPPQVAPSTEIKPDVKPDQTAPKETEIKESASNSEPKDSAAEPKKHEYSIVVPDNVKNSWTGVKLQISDKKDKKMSNVDLGLGGNYKIPNTNITITVNQFLPDFRIDSITITSTSNNPNNPAVKVSITEGTSELFNGWIFAKYPTAHPFNHDRYGLSLINGIKKK
jgi:hypothetical protein